MSKIEHAFALAKERYAEMGVDVDAAMAKRTEKAFGVCLCKECGVARSKREADGSGETQ